MKRVSMAKTPSSVCGLISPPVLVTMKVRPWLIVMPGGATLISIGIGFLLLLARRLIVKQSVMGLGPIFAETADREVIDSDGLYLLYCKVARSLLRDVDEIFHKVIGLPTPGRIPRLEEDSLAALNPVWAQLLRFN